MHEAPLTEIKVDLLIGFANYYWQKNKKKKQTNDTKQYFFLAAPVADAAKKGPLI